jgi:hypothetical protein
LADPAAGTYRTFAYEGQPADNPELKSFMEENAERLNPSVSSVLPQRRGVSPVRLDPELNLLEDYLAARVRREYPSSGQRVMGLVVVALGIRLARIQTSRHNQH